MFWVGKRSIALPRPRKGFWHAGNCQSRNCETAGLPPCDLAVRPVLLGGNQPDQRTAYAPAATAGLARDSPSCSNLRVSQRPTMTLAGGAPKGAGSRLDSYTHCEHKWRHDSHPRCMSEYAVTRDQVTEEAAGPSLRFGRRLHHAVIVVASIFSSLGPCTKLTTQLRRIRSQAATRASSFDAKARLTPSLFNRRSK